MRRLTAAFHFKKLMPPDISVVQCEWKAIGEGGGVMGVIVIVTLTYSANAPDSLPKRMVAKFSPQGKAPLPRFMIRAIFKAEAHFYNDFSIKQGAPSALEPWSWSLFGRDWWPIAQPC